ncbi:hypothetical protein GX408_13520 [bacterium]|nr:hypothetical protein [bacterium]
MKLRHVFTINFFIAAFFGLSWSLFPAFFFWLYGLMPDETASWLVRLVGGSVLGFATLMWYGMQTASIDMRKAIALALLVQDIIGFTASLIFQFSGKVNFFGWMSLAMYGGFAFIYAFFLFVKPEES